jgi:pilus assembly protein Flp/PilA
MNMMRKFLTCDSGATAIEYGLIAAGIAVVIVAAVRGIGTDLTSTFTKVSDNLK